LQAHAAPAALPVGETGCASGGAASRGTGCRACRPCPPAGRGRSPSMSFFSAGAWEHPLRAEGAEIPTVVVLLLGRGRDGEGDGRSDFHARVGYRM